MRRRLIVIAVVILVALGVAVAVWAAGGTGSSGKDACAKTITVQDTMSPRMMEYHRADCDDDFAVDRSKAGD